MFRETIEQTLDNTFNVRNEYKNLTVEELQEIAKKDFLPFRVCAINIEGDLNIGMMIRSASLLGAEKFYVFGRRKIDRRSLVGAQNYIPIQRINGFDVDGEVDLDKFIELCAVDKLFPIMCETGGPSIGKLDWSHYEKMTGNNYTLCLVFGNESNGFPQSFMNSPIPRVAIPQRGVLRSFNVAAAASIVMWELSQYLTNKK